MSKAFVLGSINIDLFLSLDHIVQESETIHVLESIEFLGGKGANQAVAVARCAGVVRLVANVGINDHQRLIKELSGYGIIPGLTTDKLTGQAIIQVDKKGGNAILLIPNANKSWDFNQILLHLEEIQDDDYVILQNEVSLDVVKEILDRFKDLKLTVVLNPAPFTMDVLEIIQYVDLLILNRIEAEQLLLASGLHASGPKE